MRRPGLRSAALQLARLSVGIAGLALATPALADDPSDAELDRGSRAPAADSQQSVTLEVLEILRSSGTIDDARYRELRERALAEEETAREQAEAAGQAAAEAELSNPKGWSVKWKNTMRVERNDGAFKFRFGGRVHIDGAVFAPSQGLSAFLRNPDSVVNDGVTGQSGGTQTGAEFRRARLYAEGRIYDRFLFKAEYEFASGGGSVGLTDVYVGLAKIPFLGTARVGHFRESYSLEALTSSKYLTFMERSLINVFDPNRNTGIGFQNNAFDERMMWRIGGFRGDTNDVGKGFGPDALYNIAMRVTGLPWYEDEGRFLIHLGIDYSHEFKDGTSVSYSERPEDNLAPDLVNAVLGPSNSVDKLTGELAGVFGPVAFQAEYVSNWVNRRGNPNVRFWGAYAQMGWFVTGEHRAYNRKYGNFGRVSRKRNFTPWRSRQDLGALELGIRYAYLSLDDADVRGGTMGDFTAGLNWYWFPNFRLMFNYVYSRLYGAGHSHNGEMRLSLDF